MTKKDFWHNYQTTVDTNTVFTGIVIILMRLRQRRRRTIVDTQHLFINLREEIIKQYINILSGFGKLNSYDLSILS